MQNSPDPAWTQSQATTYEATIEAVSDVIAGYSHQIGEEESNASPDPEHIAWLLIRIRQAKLALRLLDIARDKTVQAVLDEFGSIAQAQARITGKLSLDNVDLGNPETFSLSDEHLQHIYQNHVAPVLFDNARESKHPTAIVLGGQPGSGKSPMTCKILQEFENTDDIVPIITDDLRAFLPYYHSLQISEDKLAAFFTGPDTGRLVEMAIADAARRKVNVLVEGTMRSPDVVRKTLGGFRSNGYFTDARVLVVHPALSKLSTMQRYAAQKENRGRGRATTDEAHTAALHGLTISVDIIQREKLADRLSLYGRGNVLIDRFDLKHNSQDKGTSAKDIIQVEHDRVLTPNEQDYLRREDDRLDAIIGE